MDKERTMKKITLKKGKEKPILFHHHWIFSGAVKSIPLLEQGELVEVYTESNQKLGIAYTNPKGSLFGRMLAFGETSTNDAIEQAIDDALSLRQTLFENSYTNAYRLINGEGDRLPGLIVDRYDDHLVLQIGTKGIDLLKPLILDLLRKKLPDITCIYEKSDLPTRIQEGLKAEEQVLYGQLNSELIIKENGLLFKIDILKGQKTGFFLDQREMRALIGQLAKNKTVVNCFSYSGGFSLFALKGCAKKVRSVDISQKALVICDENIQLNQLNSSHESICEDVFKFLQNDELQDDIVILDPPAFAKKKEDIINACKGYKEINRKAMQKMKKGAFLLTASCSYHIDEILFQQVLFQAAAEANRNMKILSRHRLALDHTVNIYHKEGEYLKSFLLEVN
jgi:23S rRNA (cytosine1962-C5)-methyltransferase